jgi:ubiquinone/menaquinone biosynthesis C-methylase UbiE
VRKFTHREKQQVYDFWNRASCGEDLYLSDSDKAGYLAQAKARYRLEGEMIFGLARFEETRGLKVLEVGVGLGADHQKFAEAGADLWGIDLTERAVEHTRRRLETFGLISKLAVGDAENIAFPDESFDRVYSWGVLHHSPDTPKAIAEVWRVLKPGGQARVMIYHKWSMIGLMLWIRYALLTLRPWLTLTEVYSRYLESPGTKAYSVTEAKQLFATFSDVRISTPLGHGDLLESDVGQRHRGFALALARTIWPRWFIRRFLPNAGLTMLIEARK